MGQIKRRAQRKGVFLTLGITFLSLLVLSLATLILRNAEDSDERLMELAGYDRFYNIDRAASDAFLLYDTDVAGFKLTVNDSQILLRKLTDRHVDNGIASMAFSKLFFDFYLGTLYDSHIVYTLPDLYSYGLTFERRKSVQDIYYRYFFIGNASEAEVSGGVINGSWMHIFSFNESGCVYGASPPNCDPGSIGSLEVIYQSNISTSLNITAIKRSSCPLGSLCGSIRFRLMVINKTGAHLCVPPFDAPPHPACNTWAEMVVSGATTETSFLKNIIQIENAAPNGVLKPTILLGDFSNNYYYTPGGTFLAVGPGNTTATIHFTINITNPERMRVFDVAEAAIRLDLGKRMNVTTWAAESLAPGYYFPIRII